MKTQRPTKTKRVWSVLERNSVCPCSAISTHSLLGLLGRAGCEMQLECVYWLGLYISFNNTSPKTQAKARSKKSGTWDHGLGYVHEVLQVRISSKDRQLLMKHYGKSLKKTPQNKWSTYCWKMSLDLHQFQSSEFTAPCRSFPLSLLVSCFIIQQGILHTFYEIQQGDFCSNKLHTCMTNPSMQNV